MSLVQEKKCFTCLTKKYHNFTTADFIICTHVYSAKKLVSVKKKKKRLVSVLFLQFVLKSDKVLAI